MSLHAPVPASSGLHPALARRRANCRLALSLLVVVFCSFLFLAAQPSLYKAFCEWTGVYSLERADAVTRKVGAGRSIRLEFDANSFDNGLRFKPASPVIIVKTGELTHASYWVQNTLDRPLIGQAVPSYGPKLASDYVVKVDCFCFKQQAFAPHEVRELPVVFVIDPRLPRDVNTVTLSYTFFEIPVESKTGTITKTGS